MTAIDKIVLASGNAGKLREINKLFAGYGIEVVPQSEFNVPEVPETGTTFVENAIIKARHAAECTGLPAISDDSGIEVDALDARPGVYSARYAGENAGGHNVIANLVIAAGVTLQDAATLSVSAVDIDTTGTDYTLNTTSLTFAAGSGNGAGASLTEKKK